MTANKEELKTDESTPSEQAEHQTERSEDCEKVEIEPTETATGETVKSIEQTKPAMSETNEPQSTDPITEKDSEKESESASGSEASESDSEESQSTESTSDTIEPTKLVNDESASASGQPIDEVEIIEVESVGEKSANSATSQMDGHRKSSEETTSKQKAIGDTDQKQRKNLEKRTSSDSEESAVLYESSVSGPRTPPYKPNDYESDPPHDSNQFKSRGDRSPRYRDSPSPSRAFAGESRVLCKFFMKKTGCMRGDKCMFMHPGAKKGPEIQFCSEFQMNRCHNRDCLLVHATRYEEMNYELTGLLPKSVQNNRQVQGIWSSFDTTSHQRRSNIEIVPLPTDLGRPNGPRTPPPQSDRDDAGSGDKQLNAWFEDAKPDDEDAQITEEKGEFEGKKKPLDDERVAKNRKTRGQSESSYYESSGDERSSKFSKHILKIKQVPLDASVQDIEIFLEGYRYKENGIHQHTIDGSSIGVFYVEFDTNADLLRALDKNGKRLHPMDAKPIEVQRADVEDLKIALEDTNINQVGETEFIRIKGIPKGCIEQDVVQFLVGLHIVPGGIIFPLDYRYQRTNCCLVRLQSVEDAKHAIKLDGGAFPGGSRPVKVMNSSKTQFEGQLSLMKTQQVIMGQQSPQATESRSRPRHRVESEPERSDDERSPKRAKSTLDAIFPYYAADNSAELAELKRKADENNNNRPVTPTYPYNPPKHNPPRYYPSSSQARTFAKDYKPYVDRPYAKPYNHRPYVDRSYTDRSYPDRSYAERPYAERPYANRPYTDRAHVDRAYTDRSYRPISPNPYRTSPYHPRSPYRASPGQYHASHSPYRPSSSHRSSHSHRSVSPAHRESSYRPVSPERPKEQCFYESYYSNDQDDQQKRIVKAKNLPVNSSQNDVFRFFGQAELIPKRVQIFVDRVKKTTEADIEFHTLADAKKSFLLGGARLRTQMGGYCRNVSIFIHPDLAQVNLFNPLSRSITTKYNQDSMYRDLNEQVFAFPNDQQADANEHQPQLYIEPEDEAINVAKHQQAGELLGNFLTNEIQRELTASAQRNEILIGQLKNSLKQEKLTDHGDGSENEKERKKEKRSKHERSSREKEHSSHKKRSKSSDAEATKSRESSEKDASKKERSSSHRKHEKCHKSSSSHKSSHKSSSSHKSRRKDEEGEKDRKSPSKKDA